MDDTEGDRVPYRFVDGPVHGRETGVGPVDAHHSYHQGRFHRAHRLPGREVACHHARSRPDVLGRAGRSRARPTRTRCGGDVETRREEGAILGSRILIA
ncbi:hypothetical protein GCM10018791_40580 [Streptomyces zaomyceticus]|nr:hypothetical protein GCM10018791_40580 [Streptomyces zaomyceticus]